MKLLVDMNLSPRWTKLLVASGIEAEHWSSVGAPAAPDAQIMAFAREHGCVVLTHGLDFGAMLASTLGQKPSVVQIRADDVSPEAIGTAVIGALRQMSAELDAGALLSVDPARARVRLLPLPDR